MVSRISSSGREWSVVVTRAPEWLWQVGGKISPTR